MHALLIALWLAAPVPAGDLWKQYTLHFLDPKAHLLLSKQLMANGDRLTAFFISEAARRNYFGDEVFDPAFREVFLDDHFDNSVAAEKRVAAEVAQTPGDAAKRVQLADIYLSRNEWKSAESELRKAIGLAPDTFQYVVVLAEVLRNDGRVKEGEQLMKAWVVRHPDTVESSSMRAAELLSSKPAEAAQLIDAGLAKYPDAAPLHLVRAQLLFARSDTAGAAKEFSRAAELDPKSALAQGSAGLFFLKTAHDKERALNYYLNAYFLDPHYYDGEYAESRIRDLAYGRAEARKGMTTLSVRLADADRLVVELAIEEANENWSDDLMAPLLALLRSDYPSSRYQAARILSLHLKPDDERLDRLLKDDDVRVRGAAAYIAGALRGAAIVPLMVSWLADPTELIQYDAVSVLALNGGPAGRAELVKFQQRQAVKNPHLRTLIERALSQNR